MVWGPLLWCERRGWSLLLWETLRIKGHGAGGEHGNKEVNAAEICKARSVLVDSLAMA